MGGAPGLSLVTSRKYLRKIRRYFRLVTRLTRAGHETKPHPTLLFTLANKIIHTQSIVIYRRADDSQQHRTAEYTAKQGSEIAQGSTVIHTQ